MTNIDKVYWFVTGAGVGAWVVAMVLLFPFGTDPAPVIETRTEYVTSTVVQIVEVETERVISNTRIEFRNDPQELCFPGWMTAVSPVLIEQQNGSIMPWLFNTAGTFTANFCFTGARTDLTGVQLWENVRLGGRPEGGP